MFDKNKIALTILFSLLFYGISAQTMKKECCAKEITKITSVPYIPELSGDSIYWNLVVQGKDILPCLILNLTNTTQTNIDIPNFGGYYCIGDIAFSILCQIIHGIPIEKFIQENKKYPLSEDLNYHSFVSCKNRNRRYLKKKIFNWIKENEAQMIWVVDSNNYKTTKDWNYQINRNPANGFYIVPSY